MIASSRILTSLGITRIGEITGLDSLGIPVALATRPNSFSLSVNLGKGGDAASARASAAMEAAEIAIAERLPDNGVVASESELIASGYSVLDLSRIARCQPHRLDPDEALLWVKGQSLFTGQDVMVPWALTGSTIVQMRRAITTPSKLRRTGLPLETCWPRRCFMLYANWSSATPMLSSN